ncbi:hypothetical protein HNQ80_000971 [Anaerosolibacter carboniphilus]|uniref:Uncharacterized protein n=1 Tax=Anaerosolibacter carboniphilus TaxID=1417629 RepID=A0A841KN73_9FIRM|nr:hypothetical protein [Anaerosolibacter carboniphilus]MBB6214886.1 hypothetical protein [Anaerosolibacter carboniphilus]
MEDDRKDELVVTADFIRRVTKEARLVKLEELYEEPTSLSQERLNDMLEQITINPDFADIKSIRGSERLYFYSSKDMTENYAKILVRIEDKDLLKMVAETVRHESKIYPRPTDGRLFSTPPFSFGENELSSVMSQLKDQEIYQDIQEARASNGAVYLYSERFMTKDHAMALTEWIEVLQHETP